MTQKLLSVLWLLFCVINTSAQSVCDSVSISPDTVHINQLTNQAAFIDVIYTGQNDVSYAICAFIFTDSLNMDINDLAVTNGVAGPFIFSPEGGVGHHL